MSIAHPRQWQQNNHIHRVPAKVTTNVPCPSLTREMATKQPCPSHTRDNGNKNSHIHRMPAKVTINVPCPPRTSEMATKQPIHRIPATMSTKQPHPSHAHESRYQCTKSIANPRNGNQNNHVHRILATMAIKTTPSITCPRKPLPMYQVHR